MPGLPTFSVFSSKRTVYFFCIVLEAEHGRKGNVALPHLQNYPDKGIGRTYLTEKIPSFSLQPSCSMQIYGGLRLMQKSWFGWPAVVFFTFPFGLTCEIPDITSHLRAMTSLEYECRPALSSCSPDICIVTYWLSLHFLWSKAVCLGSKCTARHSGTLPQGRYFLIFVKDLAAYKGHQHNCVTCSKCVKWGKSVPGYGLNLV